MKNNEEEETRKEEGVAALKKKLHQTTCHLLSKETALNLSNDMSFAINIDVHARATTSPSTNDASFSSQPNDRSFDIYTNDTLLDHTHERQCIKMQTTRRFVPMCRRPVVQFPFYRFFFFIFKQVFT